MNDKEAQLLNDPVARGLCPSCGDEVGDDFRDDASRREAAISGMCQNCQDDYFGDQKTAGFYGDDEDINCPKCEGTEVHEGDCPNGKALADAQAQGILNAEEVGSHQYDDDGNVRIDPATCGTCGRTWNDAFITGVTPAPAARCPFEGDHTYIEDCACGHGPEEHFGREGEQCDGCGGECQGNQNAIYLDPDNADEPLSRGRDYELEQEKRDTSRAETEAENRLDRESSRWIREADLGFHKVAEIKCADCGSTDAVATFSSGDKLCGTCRSTYEI